MRIAAVIVTFNPEIKNVSSLVDQLVSQHVVPVIVDNGSKNFSFEQIVRKLKTSEFISLNKNTGIAHAQNVGIEYALKQNANYVILFDQDSAIEENFIKNLVDDYTSINRQHEIASIGPRFVDARYDFYYKVINLKKFGFRKKTDVSDITEPQLTDLIISSGSLISAKVLHNVGLMNEELFIDYVDTEWCLRALSKGYKNAISSKAVMKHAIGDNVISVLGFNIPVHSPFRRYYRVRNAFYLFKMPHVPKVLALREVYFNLVHQFILVIFFKKTREYTKSFLLALKDGVKFLNNK